jgi:phytanoyl-CoA hydroxylase
LKSDGFQSDQVCERVVDSSVTMKRTQPPVGEGHKTLFERDGVLVIDTMVAPDEVAELVAILEPLLSGQIDAGGQRADFGDFDAEPSMIERTTQIMQVHDFVPGMLETGHAARTLAAARVILGEDMELDMTMVMDKLPGTATPTPWHQDEAYWLPEIPDRRSFSVWLALDDAEVENGCMWFVPGSHNQPTRTHDWIGPRGQGLKAEVADGEGVPVVLKAGSCTIHHGNMLHMAGGNVTTDRRRRALILNYRSAEMIAWERARGYDHRSENARNDGAPQTRALTPGERR